MHLPAVFRGEWIPEPVLRQKAGASWFPDLSTGGDDAGVILVFTLLIGIAAFITWFFRRIRSKRSGTSDRTAIESGMAVMSPDQIRFVHRDLSIQYSISEVSELKVIESGSAEIVMIITDSQQARASYHFKAASLHMQANFHRLIQHWRTKIHRLTHLRSGTVQTAWDPC